MARNGKAKTADVGDLRFRVAGHRARSIRKQVARGVFEKIELCEVLLEGVDGHKRDHVKVLIEDSQRARFPYKACFTLSLQQQEEFEFDSDAEEESSGAAAH